MLTIRSPVRTVIKRKNMSSAMNYPDVLEANRGILAEACEIMGGMSVEYVVVGGWVPYLRGSEQARLRLQGCGRH